MNDHELATLLTSYTKCREVFERSPEEVNALVANFLQNIRTGAHLNAFVRTYDKAAIEAGKLATDRFRQQQARPLEGMTIGLKDLYCYKDHPVQAASKILEGFVSQITATSVERLLTAGAIILGHQNCDEFAMGSSNQKSIYGPAKNAIDPTRVPGGSSGGGAVALQGKMCHVSLGTDTGGSVRQPAALCGVIGFKPSYGRISRYGVISFASSFDTVSIFSHTIPDCAKVLEVIAGEDPADNTSSRKPVPTYSSLLDTNGKKYKLAYLKEMLFHPSLQQEVKEATLTMFERLRAQGHEIVEVDFPLLRYALPTYYILTTSEASSNLARYDGVRYGYRATGDSLQEMSYNTRTLGFGSEVKRRILLGNFVLSAHSYEAYYTKAQKVRRLIKNSLEGILNSYDFILSPTTPTTAFALDSAHTEDPILEYLADLFTVPAPIAGLPAISIPNGVDQNALPIGLQIIGSAFREEDLLAFAHYLMEGDV